MLTPHNDVIAAIATPIGEGGISVIRVSGDGAVSIVDKNFRGRQALVSVSTHTAHFGLFIDAKGNTVDQVVATVFREPHSYTGEDIVEIGCHGGMYVTQKILESVLRSGARIARAGEFTQRAFLNGQMDLSQAEAVADLVHAQSEASHRASLSQLQGGVSERVRQIRNRLIDLSGLLELGLDFSEEGIDLIDQDRLEASVISSITDVQNYLETYKLGRIAREGVRVALIGRPNVGKSSIFNSLLNHEKAIVTSIPGTTRDAIEGNIIIGGIIFTIVDTAGIRKSSDVVEIEGMRRTEMEIQKSDVLLLVVDSYSGIINEDIEIFVRAKKILGNSKSVITVYNKLDIGADYSDLPLDELSEQERCAISAKGQIGLFELRSNLLRKTLAITTTSSADRSIAITNARHRDALEKSKKRLEAALHDLRAGTSMEFVSPSLRMAIADLGEIIGIVSSEDVLNRIFSKFCVGK